MPIDPAHRYGIEDACPRHEDGHLPDWHTAYLESDGGEVYVDVKCKYCHRVGCLGLLTKLVQDISW